MKSYIPILTLIGLSLLTSSCDKYRRSSPHVKPHVTAPIHHSIVDAIPLDNGSYAYSQKDDTTGQMIWYYLWFTALNSNDSVSNSRHYYSGNYGSVSSIYSSRYSPSQMGRIIETKEPPVEIVDKDGNGKIEPGEQVEPKGEEAAVEQADTKLVEQENAEIDHENQAAIESFENEGGAVAPAAEEEAPQSTPAESSPSSESSSESSSSSDSGGGGGDGGGGGGGD